MPDSPTSAPPESTRMERILVWAPGGRTSSLIADALEQAGLSVAPCETADAFGRLVREGVGAALLTEEVFSRDAHIDPLAQLLAEQPAWSDLPVTVFVSGARCILPFQRRLAQLTSRRGVTVVERPVNPEVLVSLAEAALRDRRRQYDLRDALTVLRDQAAALEERVEGQAGQLRRLAGRLARAEQAERRRISQLLHDDVQQLLYGVSMKMHFIGKATRDAEVEEHLEEATTWMDQAMDTTRQLTTDLSPPVLEGENLTGAMEWLGLHMEELHGLKVTVTTEGRHPVADEALRTLLFQITRELLFNVKKHAGVDAAAVRLTEESGHLAIHVIDEGRGFDVEEATARDDEAGGFGLFSVRERLQLMGGRLEIRSAPGEGTRAIVHASSDEAEAAGGAAGAASAETGAEQAAVRVFAVDDHPILREMLVALLEHEGDMVICGEAQTGEEALQTIGDVAPDLVLVDISLPNMSGIELARRLRETHPDLAVLMLSAHAEGRYVEQAFEAGAVGYVLKGDAASIPEAVRQADRGVSYVSPRLRRHVRGQASSARRPARS